MTPTKNYSDEEKSRNRERYMQSRMGDLTSYAALIGESFSSKVNLLAQIIRDAHEPSLGTYKERLLLELISQFIPRRYDVGTGFVIFPTERQFASGVPEDYDILNSSDHVVSRQCDIIVYDATDYPVVFKDDDFVVVRPESVRSIVEVKGSLSSKEVDSFMSHFIDFGRKWKQCNDFYRGNYQKKLGEVTLAVMAWQVAVDPEGRPKNDGRRLREQITRIYKNEMKKEELKYFPVLEAAFIYNDCEVSSALGMSPSDNFEYGFVTHRGKFVRFTSDGRPMEGGDQTIASLLARIHWSLDSPYNRFFSSFDQTKRPDLFAHPDSGFSIWLEGDDIELFGWKERESKH